MKLYKKAVVAILISHKVNFKTEYFKKLRTFHKEKNSTGRLNTL